MTAYAIAHHFLLAILWGFVFALIYKMLTADRAVNLVAAGGWEPTLLVRHKGQEYRRRMSSGERILIGRTADSHVRIDQAGLPLHIGCLTHNQRNVTFTPNKSCTATLNGRGTVMEKGISLREGDQLNLSDMNIMIEVTG